MRRVHLTNENKRVHAEKVKKAIQNRKVLNGNNINLSPSLRVGNTRTVSGAVFRMDDDRYVMKLMYFKYQDEKDQHEKEYRIAKILGDAGVGPKVYSMQEVSLDYYALPSNLLANRVTRMRKAVIIVMENLAHGAAKLETLYKYVKRTRDYPEKEIIDLYNKMRSVKVHHGDLHAANIIVKTLPSGKIRLYFIDFGRSIVTNNVNKYFQGKIPNSKGLYEINKMIMTRNENMLKKIKTLKNNYPRMTFVTPVLNFILPAS